MKVLSWSGLTIDNQGISWLSLFDRLYRKFVKNYGKINAPFIALLKKVHLSRVWRWKRLSND